VSRYPVCLASQSVTFHSLLGINVGEAKLWEVLQGACHAFNEPKASTAAGAHCFSFSRLPSDFRPRCE
jgi:hypothetical protein